MVVARCDRARRRDAARDHRQNRQGALAGRVGRSRARARDSRRPRMTTRRDVLAGLAAATTVGASPGYAVQHIREKHPRSEEHTSELQSLMRISYAVFCLKKKTTTQQT